MQKQTFDDFLDISGIHSRERTIMLDISYIPMREDFGEDDILLEQLTVLKSLPEEKHSIQDIVKEKARQLKRKVIQTLENYSKMIAQKDNTIKDKIPKDIDSIQIQLREIQNLRNQVADKEVEAIVKLVNEFVAKMSIKQEKVIKQPSQPTTPIMKSQSYESDESTALPSKTLQAINQKIKDLIGQIPKITEHDKIITLAQQFLDNDTPEVFKKLRAEQKVLQSESANLVNKLVKACFLKIKLQEQNQNNSKREFYDTVIRMKSYMPPDHQAHQIMISSLYEEMKGVPSTEWEIYMKQKLNI
ncbi:hypothetical protein pb186bvf_002692 [Paramecium bursaria]